ncbi:uncharacterized protein [Rutidosis leptorrhynchoides]|uniref:uncharacterized protein n=1 Tax=Rutidosis leptorrhynchoides TaxID=125765 RepID=UPI003A9A4495
MKYLGVPLLAKRLGIKDCKCLVDKVKNKVNNWKLKKLSYAGRLQLASSVLNAMQTYWASVYVLPYNIVKEIDKLLKGFLWAQADSAKGKAKVAWKDVCVPKDQGGLGLRPLKDWTETLIVKQIRRIISKEESLWSKWVNLIKLKCISFWDITAGYNDSWGWKYLLDLRDKVKHHFGSVYVNGRIKWVWITNDGKSVPFSTHQVWKDLRVNRAKVSWWHVIWYKGFDPKHAFLLWLAVLDRLNTQERMAKWLPNKQFSCVFCGKEKDSIKHLFFMCEFSLQVWSELKKKLLFRGLPDKLNDIVHDLAKYPNSKSIWNVINRMVIAACVYLLWQERNYRLFKKIERDADTVCKAVQDFVQCKLLTLKVKQNDAVNRVAEMWGLKFVNNCLFLFAEKKTAKKKTTGCKIGFIHLDDYDTDDKEDLDNIPIALASAFR